MKISLVGAGSIAFATAALLSQRGHQPMLWSPSGKRGADMLVATGALTGSFAVKMAETVQELASWGEIIIFALPANGHKMTMDAIAPHLSEGQKIIISSHASFGALYLAQLLAERNLALPIIVWGTTIVTARQQSLAKVHINTIRAKVDIATLPQAQSAAGLALCESVFGTHFVDRGSILAIALSNLNPQNHCGIALGNMSRMERGEEWNQGQNITPNIGRLLEALDRERLAIAQLFNLQVRTIFEHFHLSFHIPIASISDMNQQMFAAGKGGNGPMTAQSRYVLEDVPFGLVPTVKLGKMAGVPTPLHEAGITLFSGLYGRDFYQDNDLLPAMAIEEMTLDELKAL